MAAPITQPLYRQEFVCNLVYFLLGDPQECAMLPAFLESTDKRLTHSWSISTCPLTQLLATTISCLEKHSLNNIFIPSPPACPKLQSHLVPAKTSKGQEVESCLKVGHSQRLSPPGVGMAEACSVCQQWGVLDSFLRKAEGFGKRSVLA